MDVKNVMQSENLYLKKPRLIFTSIAIHFNEWLEMLVSRLHTFRCKQPLNL